MTAPRDPKVTIRLRNEDTTLEAHGTISQNEAGQTVVTKADGTITLTVATDQVLYAHSA